MLVLGAGASFGARAALPRPPLGDELAAYLLDWLERNDPRQQDPIARVVDVTDIPADLWESLADVEPALRAASGVRGGFERAMTGLIEDGKVRALCALNRIIAVAFLAGESCRFLEGPDGYDRLFHAIGSRLHAIVTPNYDLLAEEALDRRGIVYAYAGTPENAAPVIVYKIHGAINLVQPPGGGTGATLETAQRNTRPLRAVAQGPIPGAYNDHHLYAIRGHHNTLLHHDDEYLNLVMVTYGPAKPAAWGRPLLDRIRSACSDALRAQPPARIIAVGIRPPSDDKGDDPTWSALCDLMTGLPSKKEYWSGAVDERAAMARYGFEGRNGWFEDLVSELSVSERRE